MLRLGKADTFLKKVVMMSKSSPFESVHERLGANFGEYNGWRLPSDFGDVAAESESLYSNCAAFDLCSFGKIIVKGRNASELIDKLVTANTSYHIAGAN